YKILTRIPKRKLSFELNMLKVPYSLGKQYYHSYIKVIGGAIIVSIISISFYSIWTTRKFKRPLEKIDKSLIAIINGNYNNKLELNGEMEFEIVRDTINFLIGKLKSSEEENKKLAESKNRMLMDLSHDIKTPITTIQGFSAALAGGMVETDEKKEQYYKTIYNKSERVSELVDELFEFVKLQEKNYVVNCEKTDLSEFLRQIVVGYMEELEAKGFEVEVNIPEEEIYCFIDSKSFKRVINNLIDNAIKYNKPGTKLRVEVRDVGSYIVIEIADNGIGIPNEIADKIFDPFIRGDKSRKSDGGSGLGLSIAQKIVESHGGTISLINSNEKEKTIFYIKLMK
ncbi:MAG: HAMP domain-containing histidine kinase, partial [Clostridiales bacterium]|nr:HAMP domain-containing histidine kinase [Clostridiales bacterium]